MILLDLLVLGWNEDVESRFLYFVSRTVELPFPVRRCTQHEIGTAPTFGKFGLPNCK